MSYSGSLAVSGQGSVLAINTGTTGSPTWTVVGEVMEITPSGRKNTTADSTNLQSTFKEFVPTIPDGGMLTLKGNYIGTDAGQVAMETAFENQTKPQFQLTLPKTGTQTTSGDVRTFVAIVEENNSPATLSNGKLIDFSTQLKISGATTVVRGT